MAFFFLFLKITTRGSGTSVQCFARDSVLTSPELGSATLGVSEKLEVC